MSDSISALDDDYVRLGSVAAIVAQERQQYAPDDVMDLFRRALFVGELDAPPFESETRNDPCKWLHMEIEAPRCTPAGIRRTREVPSAARHRRSWTHNGRCCASGCAEPAFLPTYRAEAPVQDFYEFCGIADEPSFLSFRLEWRLDRRLALQPCRHLELLDAQESWIEQLRLITRAIVGKDGDDDVV